jgi:hypothetical protein
VSAFIRPLLRALALLPLIASVALGCAKRGSSLKTARGSPPQPSGGVQLMEIGSPGEFAAAYRARFTGATDEELRRLCAGSDRTLALGAGWEKVRRATPVVQEEGPPRPSSSALARFLEIVRDRVGEPAPVWEKTVRASFLSGADISFSPEPEPAMDLEALGLYRRQQPPTRPAAQEPSSDDFLRIAANDVRSVRTDPFARHAYFNAACVLLTLDAAYVALYEKWPASPYPLYAIARPSGKILWSTRVWAEDGFLLGIYDGQGFGKVELREHGDEVVAFGVSVGVAYIEVFEGATGVCRVRFCTEYFDSR